MNTSTLLTIGFWSRLWSTHGDEVVGTTAKVAFIVFAYYVFKLLILRLVGRFTQTVLARGNEGAYTARQARILALQSVLQSSLGFVFGFIAVSMVLEAAHVDIKALITAAGVAGLAVGFGAQKLVRDVIAGVFILIEDHYGVGDYVTIGALSGTVVEVGMRITRIRDTSGRMCVIPNGDIAQVCNHSRGHLVITQDISVPATADLQKVTNVIDEVGRKLSEDMPGAVRAPFTCKGLAQIGGANVSVRLEGGVAPAEQQTVLLELNARLREAFDRSGITLA